MSLAETCSCFGMYLWLRVLYPTGKEVVITQKCTYTCSVVFTYHKDNTVRTVVVLHHKVLSYITQISYRAMKVFVHVFIVITMSKM